MKLLLKSLIAFFKDNGPLHAGSIAYFFLMSFVPFCLFLIAIFGYFLGDNKEFYAFFSARMTRFFPAATSEISRGLTAIVTYRRIGIVTLIIYAYFSYLLYVSVESAIHLIFQEKAKRSRLISIIMSFFIISLIAVLITISFAATSVIQMLKLIIMDSTGLQIGIITGFLIRFVIPVFLVFIIATILYKLMPVKKTAFRNSLWGGFFTAIFLEVARHFFTLYVVNAAGRFGTIYGSLSSVVIFLLWVFYAACIFLIGAEIVKNLSDAERKMR
jgi:membrane protein